MTTISLPIPAITDRIRQAATVWRAYRDRPRTARVTAILCPACHTWRPPRHYRRNATACRICTG
jgi:hypothetical protein